jgi:hypothetical protein
MLKEIHPISNVLPDQQISIPSGDEAYVIGTIKPLYSGMSVVMQHAPGLIDNLPASLPGPVTEVSILPVKGSK